MNRVRLWVFFFFKQKTAYEMRMSDWSSDVCSSDLNPLFAARIREWLKVLRKKNVSVIFATQSLADIRDSSIAPAIIESCASRLFLANPQAVEPQIRTIYEGIGLNARQIQLVAHAQPKQYYYYQSRLGHRMFDLGLGPVSLAFAWADAPEDQRDIDEVLAGHGRDGFAEAWLRHRVLAWADDMNNPLPAMAAVVPFSSVAVFSDVSFYKTPT